jgi:hypothetical protein
MTSLILALTLASHNPYHWTMSCKRFQEVTMEIMMDKNLDYQARQMLIRKFRGKVEEKCDNTFI